ncbi:MAG: CDP-glycerol glycerophosphotransferase family protein [Lachnospiraceae bacterium]|nr:CDP-glycerol glycerophosphotransferase family protein [Lachnospiraceae bacterium]
MINWIKYILLVSLRKILNIFNIFPIKKNRLLFYSYNGKQYSCNPRQITENLVQNNSQQFEIIWAFKDPKYMRNKIPSNCKAVKYRSILYYYYAKTSRIIIQNVQGYGELQRRKEQDVIQTWHASNGYKQQGRCDGVKRKLELLYHGDYTYVMGGSKSMIERRVRGTMGFDGNVIPGTPRMDLIINRHENDFKEKVYSFLKVDTDEKIVLYAPTWRNNRNDNDYGMDYFIVKSAFEKRFGGKWTIVVRLHPNVYTPLDITEPYVKDGTKYPDIQELLCVSDALISDYSSCVWDFSFRYKPCFLFCNDIEKYGNDRDFDIPVREWHFPMATDMVALKNVIETFDEDVFKSNIKLHHEEMGSLEDGKATDRVCALINELCFPIEKGADA